MNYNLNYGTLDENNNLIYAPQNVEINDNWYIPATGEQLVEAGYYKIVNTPYPTDKKEYTYSWEIIGDEVVKIWTEVPIPPDTRTPAQKREEQYEKKLCIIFPENSNELITIDGAVKLVYEYSCEYTEVAEYIVSYLKQNITEQKAIIREQFPDGN